MKYNVNSSTLIRLENCEYPDVLKVEDAQAILGLSRISIYRLIKSQQIQAFQIGRVYKIPKKEMSKFLENQRGSEAK